MTEFDQAKVDMAEMQAWWNAHPEELARATKSDFAVGCSSIWFSSILNHAEVARVGYTTEFIETARFGVMLGYFLAKTQAFGIDVPEVFKEE